MSVVYALLDPGQHTFPNHCVSNTGAHLSLIHNYCVAGSNLCHCLKHY